MCAPPPGLSRLAASFIAVRLLQASAMDLCLPGHIPAPAPRASAWDTAPFTSSFPLFFLSKISYVSPAIFGRTKQ